jgi:hypothetical protein
LPYFYRQNGAPFQNAWYRVKVHVCIRYINE